MSLKLVSPDRFQVVVEDQQRRLFSAGYMPLRAMIADNPLGVLDLGGILETKVASVYEWQPCERRWIRRTVPKVDRVAVTLTLHVDGHSYETIEAKRSR